MTQPRVSVARGTQPVRQLAKIAVAFHATMCCLKCSANHCNHVNDEHEPLLLPQDPERTERRTLYGDNPDPTGGTTLYM